MAKSLNRVQLIGNLTRDPELRYTPSGSAVCSFGLATNRTWTSDDGQKHEEADFHRIVAWNKLAELCSQFLLKGRKVYVEGRLSTRNWTTQDGQPRSTTEVIIDDMILLDSKKQAEEDNDTSADREINDKENLTKENLKPSKDKKEKEEPEGLKEDSEEKDEHEEVAPDDIPF
ncbi:single-stranded DNA-binding protein [Patescibacteria group bacterium]|nr:single-stranded DNA-binding protein [Patescibacteria group bacterium]MCL5010086.1 single-stranded DNA-binding protein [Patescibacteria group bacterium]